MKGYKTRFTRSARKDVVDAQKYYRSISPELSARFVAAADHKRLQVQEQPHAFIVRYMNVRFAVLDTFPYVLHFIINEENKEVIIIGLFHEKMNPEVWR